MLDVDNTLLDNDKVKADLQDRVVQFAGEDRAETFWAEYERVRVELDYVDLGLTLSRFRAAFPDLMTYPELAAGVLFYPFEESLYPGVGDVLTHLRTMGAVAILSDGDPVFQPAKIARTGLADACDEHVLVYPHKERELEKVQSLIRADVYVFIDDKPTILQAVKEEMGQRAVTVHVRQGKYARAAEPGEPVADIELGGIVDVLGVTREQLLGHVAG